SVTTIVTTTKCHTAGDPWVTCGCCAEGDREEVVCRCGGAACRSRAGGAWRAGGAPVGRVEPVGSASGNGQPAVARRRRAACGASEAHVDVGAVLEPVEPVLPRRPHLLHVDALMEGGARLLEVGQGALLALGEQEDHQV